MCEFLAFLMFLFGCDVCDVDPGLGHAELTVTVIGCAAVINLSNDIPVRGIQFAVSGGQVTEARTTSRTEGFFTAGKNGKVLVFSLLGKTIAPGNGPILELCFDSWCSYILISNITIAH